MCLTLFALEENCFPQTLQVMEQVCAWIWHSISLLNCLLQLEQGKWLMSVLNFVPVFDEAFSGLPHGPLNDLSGALENPTEERKLFQIKLPEVHHLTSPSRTTERSDTQNTTIQRDKNNLIRTRHKEPRMKWNKNSFRALFPHFFLCFKVSLVEYFCLYIHFHFRSLYIKFFSPSIQMNFTFE